MRCPKCQYISYESGDRCRNCGYEFSLAADESTVDREPVEVVIRRDDPAPGRFRDVSLAELNSDASAARGAGDLPLFTSRVADDQAPLVTPPAVPRPPLSVRRAAPAARPRPRPARPDDLPLDEGHADETRPAADATLEHAEAGARGAVLRRFGAGLIDSTILLAIAAAVVYLTLRASGLSVEQWRVLPLVPLVAFLLLLCGGYFILFTAAGGQTIGKMTTRIRVVSVPEETSGGLRVSFAAALVRTVCALGSVAALGAGFLPVLLRSDRRAFHDRMAHTRVVSA
jgi:uncharacterized RDD family membrane protein YckC